MCLIFNIIQIVYHVHRVIWPNEYIAGGVLMRARSEY